ncbi:hypothetical protein D3C71_2170410 [compost metagenome]
MLGVVGGPCIETDAAVRQSNEVRTVPCSLAFLVTEDCFDDLRHAPVGCELNGFKLSTEHPQATLKKRL